MGAKAAEIIIKFQAVGNQQVRRGLKQIEADSKASGQKVTREAEANNKTLLKNEKRNAKLIAALHAALAATKKRLGDKATADAKRAADKASRDAKKAADQQARDAKKSADKQARDHAKAERKQTADTKREAAERSKAAAKEAADLKRWMRETERDRRRAARVEVQGLRTLDRERRASRTRTMRLLAAGGAGVGVVAGAALGAAERAQGVLGVRSQESIVSDAIALRQALIAQVAQNGGTEADANAIYARTISTAQANNVSPVDALSTVVRLQEQFSTLGTAMQGGEQGMNDFFANLEGNMRMARASTDSTENVSIALSSLASQFHLDAAQVHEAQGVLFEASKDGSLTMRDFGEQFPQVIAPFLNARGAEGQGVGGVREFAALSQTIQASTLNPERTRTLLGAMLQNLSDVNVQERMALPIAEGGLGIQARAADGSLRSPAAIAAEMARHPEILNSTNFRTIFHDQESSAAFAALVQQERAGHGAASRLGLDANAGNQSILDTNRALNADSSGRAQQMVNDREATALLQADQMIQANITLAGGITGLQNEFPRLSMAVETLTPVVEKFIGFMVARALLPGSWALGGAPAATAVPGVIPGVSQVAPATAAAGGAGLLSNVLAPVLALSGLRAMMAERQDGGTLGRGGAVMQGEQRMWASLGNPMGIGLTEEQHSANVSLRGVTRGSGAATDGNREVVRAQNQTSQQIVAAVREVATAVRQIPAGTAPNTGDTATRGQRE